MKVHVRANLAIAIGLLLGVVAIETARSQNTELRVPKKPPPSVQGERVIPLDTFPGRADFNPPGNPPEKSATWPGEQFAGSCGIVDSKLTIRQDGSASFSSRVASGSSGDSYCITFHFFDRNQLQLYEWPRICSPSLGGSFAPWNDNDLAIPEYFYQYIVFATRADHC
jgi:hypothetical protein